MATQDEEPLIEVQGVLARREALESAGNLVDQVMMLGFDQKDLLRRVTTWLTLPRYRVLPMEFKRRIKNYCIAFRPDFIKTLSMDDEQDRMETPLSTSVPISQAIKTGYFEKVMGDLKSMVQEEVVHDENDRTTMNKRIQVLEEKIKFLEKKEAELSIRCEVQKEHDLVTGADVRDLKRRVGKLEGFEQSVGKRSKTIDLGSSDHDDDTDSELEITAVRTRSSNGTPMELKATPRSPSLFVRSPVPHGDCLRQESSIFMQRPQSDSSDSSSTDPSLQAFLDRCIG